ncbi:hypothetical protein [Phenylobacterium sp.]|uniref:hypothetical protein n=1 Tax=Phenylobacterium sp. TaxID=1871053 RepID=UPI00120FCD76|nr:hypothetical protein [Phenylobacterium sp.]THD60081.1 MAG: hypothetical protein E8A49_14880 [Phenylobacterium sp.]
MPVYHFHALTAPDQPPETVVLFSDAAAARVALGVRFPGGCDVWQGKRYVGRFHRGAGKPPPDGG